MDLGCGYGALMYFARRAGYLRIDGVDHSIEQVDAAQRLGIEGARVGDLIEALRTTRDESQDVVIAFDVIHTFKKEELIRFVDEVWRILRPGGKWIIHTANAESPFAARTQNWEFVSELSFTRNSIGQLLLASGFTYVECFEDAPVPHGITSAIRWALWKVIRLFLITCLAVETGRWDSNAVFSQVFLAVAKK
jgi:SAM-dependent methyltransferase